MNSRQRRAQRYREQCKRLDRQLTEALNGCSYRVAKAVNGVSLRRGNKWNDNDPT